MKHIFFRYTAALLSLVMVITLLLPLWDLHVLADETKAKNEVGVISIISGYCPEQNEWEALLHTDENNAYTIMLTPEDIATIAGVFVSREGSTIKFIRDAYEVWVDTTTKTATAKLRFSNEEICTLYGGSFTLSEYIKLNNKTSTDYLPMEEMFYLLNLTWGFCEDKQALTIDAPAETLLNIVSEYDLLYSGLPSYSDVVGETAGEIWSNAFMFSVLALGDEVDYRIFSGFWFETSKTTEALLEMCVPAASQADEAEQKILGAYMDTYRAPTGEMLENLMQFDEKLPLNDAMDGLVEAFTGRKFADFGLEFSGVAENVSYLVDAWKICEVVTRSQNWNAGYVKQLKLLSEVETDFFQYDSVRAVKEAAKSLYTEYGKTVGTEAWELAKWTASTVVDALLVQKANPAALTLAAYDLTVDTLAIAIPEVGEALATGENAYKAKCGYNITTVARWEYVKTLQSLMKGNVSATDIEAIRTAGTLLSNASAHTWKNLYYVKRNMNQTTTRTQEKFQDNIAYTARFDESVAFDARLLLNRDFSNLYIDNMRKKVPESYVRDRYICIYTFQDFLNIPAHGDARYILMDNIVCPSNYTSLYADNNRFTGELNGNNFTISNISQPLFRAFYNADVKDLHLVVTNVNASTTLKQCSNYGALVSISRSSRIENCTVTGGSITANYPGNIGGIAGYCEYSTIRGCSNEVSTTLSISEGRGRVGGIAGYSKESSYYDNTNTGNMRVSNSYTGNNLHCDRLAFAGGIAGAAEMGGASRTENCMNTGEIYASGGKFVRTMAGGIYAEANSLTEQGGWIIKCRNSGKVTATSPLVNTENLKEDLTSGVDNINFMFWYIEPDEGLAGGIVGLTSLCTLSHCQNDGTVNGSYYAGGMMAMNWDSSIRNVYNKGSVSGGFGAGGIVGYVYGSEQASSFINCFNGGNVGNASVSGAFAGLLADENLVTRGCYYIQSSGPKKAVSICAKSNTGNTFSSVATASASSLVDYDFQKIWEYDETSGAIGMRFE